MYRETFLTREGGPRGAVSEERFGVCVWGGDFGFRGSGVLKQLKRDGGRVRKFGLPNLATPFLSEPSC